MYFRILNKNKTICQKKRTKSFSQEEKFFYTLFNDKTLAHKLFDVFISECIIGTYYFTRTTQKLYHNTVCLFLVKFPLAFQRCKVGKKVDCITYYTEEIFLVQVCIVTKIYKETSHFLLYKT